MNRPAGQTGVELDRLKELLLRPETDRLDAVEAQVEALEARVGASDRLEIATAEILVEAFRRAEIARHRELATAVAPVVVAAIRSEIVNSKDMMVEALYPITGRLVAAAVANAFRDLIADLNERLDRTLSTHHWRLRFKSLATGRPVSELALAEAQRPTLRRLLLLERGSGRLVAAWHAGGEEESQSELVSGLIAAITEFASSVYGARGGELRTLDLGGARVFLRGAPVYLVAAECAGALGPEHEREIDDAFLSLVSRIEHKQADAAPALKHMGETLFRQIAPADRKSGLPLVVILVALAGLAAWFASGPILRGLHERRIDTALQQAIAARPELSDYPLRAEVDHAHRGVTLLGLAPSEAAARQVVDAISTAAAPYAVNERIAAIATVQQAGDMQRRIETLESQLAAADRDARAASEAAGAERRALEAKARAADESLAALAAVAPTAREKMGVLLARTAIFFTQQDKFADPAKAEQRADEIAAALKGNDFVVRVLGHADPSGSDRRNIVIAQNRAQAVVDMLVARGVARERLIAAARSSLLPIGAAGDLRDRRVTFELAFEDEKSP